MGFASASSDTDNFGCPLGKLTDDQQIVASGIRFHKKASASSSVGRVMTPATNRGYLLGLSLEAGHSRKIFREHHSTVHSFAQNSVYVRNFADEYKADLKGPFQFVLMEITDAAVGQIAEDADIRGAIELHSRSEEADPVLGGLVAALFAGASGKGQKSALFADQLSIAIGVHLVHHYGNGRTRTNDRGRGLSRRMEVLAKELIESRLDGDVSIDELAGVCNMSRSTFLRAFRETTGKTPHQWQMQQRIGKARALLLSSVLSLSEIAATCGFADQSHFTRVFSAEFGVTPGLWRRSKQF